MPRLSILSFDFSYEHPYAEGHVCTRAEAECLALALNRGLAKGLYRMITQASALGLAPRDEVQAAAERFVSEHLRGFSFGHERLRAVEGEARRIAQGLVEAELYARGLSAKQCSDFDDRVEVVASRAGVLTEASRRVDDVQRIAREAHAELLSAGEDGEGL